jgi:hypothetical protein
MSRHLLPGVVQTSFPVEYNLVPDHSIWNCIVRNGTQ